MLLLVQVHLERDLDLRQSGLVGCGDRSSSEPVGMHGGMYWVFLDSSRHYLRLGDDDLREELQVGGGLLFSSYDARCPWLHRRDVLPNEEVHVLVDGAMELFIRDLDRCY